MYQVNKKLLQAIIPAAIKNNASFTSAIIDTLGWGYAEFAFLLGATDIALSALKVQESDDSGMSGAADITGTVMGTDANDTGSTSTLPSATDDNKIFKFEIDLRGRKRYLQLVATVGSGSTGAYGAALCELSRGAQVPTSATDKGAAQVMRV